MNRDCLAFDRSTVRTIDADGKLHVRISHISKATVNPYYGYEIPNYESLGLVSDQIYMLLRDPKELEKGAASFNNLQVLSKHIPSFVGANEAEWKPFVVGSTGTDAQFNAPYLDNSLVIWDAVAIAGISTQVQKEISCAYRYTPVMTTGEYDGVKYDGVMTEIIGNHVALVESGRAGSDVVVGDNNPFLEKFDMSKTSRKAVAVKAGLGAFLMPVLASDAKLDLAKIVGLPKAKTIDADATRIANAVIVASAGVLAKDKKLDAEELKKVILLAADAESDKEMDDKEPVAKDDDEQKEGESDEDYKIRMEKKTAMDNDDDGKVDKPAMDAAIALAVKDAEARTIAKMKAIKRAEDEVRPVIGSVVAQDSAEAVYKLALCHMKADLSGVEPSAYGAIYRNMAASQTTKKPNLAHDSSIDSATALSNFLAKK